MTDENRPDGPTPDHPADETAKPSASSPTVATPAAAQTPAPPGAAAAGGPAAAKPAVAARPKPKPKPPPEPPKGPPDPAPPEDMALAPVVTAVRDGVPGAVQQVSYWVGDWTIIIATDRLLDVMGFLKDDEGTSFDYCSDVTATDWPPRDKRFDVVYCLYSTRRRHRIRVKLRAGESDPVESVTGIWPGANWLEREVFDQFGINIVNHPDLRRILMPDEWQGFPQRKDYPLEGPGELLMESPQDWLRLRNLPDEAGIDSDSEIE